jgi:hypothetical protein
VERSLLLTLPGRACLYILAGPTPFYPYLLAGAMTLYWYFEPPTVEEGVQPWEDIQTQGGRWDHRLMLRFFRLKRGYSVWKDATAVWQINRFPTFDDVNQAQLFYYGGKTSIVTDAQRTEILAQTFSPAVTTANFTPAPDESTPEPAPHGDDWRPMPLPYNA